MALITQVLALEPVSKVLGQEPITPFAILLVVILVVPILFERLRLPGLVGLLAAGIVLGPHALNLLQNESPTMKLLSDIGLVYLMFVAGLEIDMDQFRKTKYRSMGYGSLGFLVPLLIGVLVSRLFNFDWDAAILIGSLFASHTLLAYPIISRLGVIGNEAVIVTIGATIFTDIASLLVLAICVGIHAGNFSIIKLLTLLASLSIYSVIVLFGFDRAGREFFRRSGNEEGNQFLFVLLALFLAAVGAQLIGVEKIVGAFLAGLAVNDVVGEGSVKDKVVFVGSVLFIPIFFVNVGLLINLPAFISSISSIGLTLALVLGPIFGKLVAALVAKFIYHYNWREMLTMWSLSLPQVAATLAATLVGYRVGLLHESVFNSVIVLMLVTATLGPVITSRVAVGLALPQTSVEIETTSSTWNTEADSPFTVIVPVYNPKTQQYLIELAALLARQTDGRVVPVAITKASTQINSPQMEIALQRSQQLLDGAVAQSLELGIDAEPLLRIDDAVAVGISRASREQNASLIVMGWAKRRGLRTHIFGNLIDSVISLSHCPVVVTRLQDSPTKIQRILVPVENLTTQVMQPLRLALMLAKANQAQVTLLHVCDRRASASSIAWIHSQLSLAVSKSALANPSDIQVMPHENVAQALLKAAQGYDLVVLRLRHFFAGESLRQRNLTGSLAFGDINTQLVAALTSSIIMYAEPLPTYNDVSPKQFRKVLQ